MNPQSRAAGALHGLAIGDALGMPTQMLPRPRIVQLYGPVVDGFHPAPDDHPLAAGMPAGAVTDDTEQALLLAGLLIEGHGRVDSAELARRLVAWQETMRARGSLDLLGPSTLHAVSQVLAGVDLEETGRTGTTNGAAMRIAPVGIAVGSTDPDLLVDRVVEASRLSHNTGVALAGAAAVAAAVSAGVDGASVVEAVEAAVDAAVRAASRGHWVAAADVAARIRWAIGLIDGLALEEVCDRVYTLVGTSLATQESVPAAFAVLWAARYDAWLACRLGASVGGDCDTIAAIVGAVGGACHGPDAFPQAVRATLAEVNRLDLDATAARLLALRAPAAKP